MINSLPRLGHLSRPRLGDLLTKKEEFVKITKFDLRWRPHNSRKKALVASWEVFALNDMLLMDNIVSIRIMGSLTTGSRKAVNVTALVSINDEEGYSKGSDPNEPAAIEAALALAGVEFDQDLSTEGDVIEALTLVARELGYRNDVAIRRSTIWTQKKHPRR